MANSKTVGELTELVIMTELTRRGKTVLVPWGDNQRYDLAVDEGEGRVTRIQCKTGRLKQSKGVIVFATCSSYAHRGKGKKSYRGEADEFYVYCPDNGKIYVVPVMEASRREMWLRVEPTKNGQAQNVRWAKDYELV